MRRLFVLYSFSLGLAGAAQVTRSEVITELNYARQNPQVYANYILMRHMDQLAAHDKDCRRPVADWAAVSEAERALRAAKPAPPLQEFAPLDQAASDLVKDQAAHGGDGHAGSDGSSSKDRILRHAKGLKEYSEITYYGPEDARSMVITMLVDATNPARGNRHDLLDPVFHYVGVGTGPHARYKGMCIIEVAR